MLQLENRNVDESHENITDQVDSAQERRHLYEQIVTDRAIASQTPEAQQDIEDKAGQALNALVLDKKVLQQMRSLTRKEATKNLPQNSDAQAGYALLFLRANVRHRNKSSFSDSHLSFTKAKKRLQPDMIGSLQQACKESVQNTPPTKPDAPSNNTEDGLDEVLTVNLSRNPHIQKVYKDEIDEIFGGIDALKKLSTNQAIQKIENKIIHTLTTEQTLSLNYIALLHHLKPVKEIVLRNLLPSFMETNQITTIQADKEKIRYLQEVEVLDISNSSITTLPNTIGELQNLHSILIENSKLEALPTSIGNLQNLSSLVLNGNPLTSLPDELYTLKELKILLVNDTNIQNISEDISQLTKLSFLYTHNTQIQALPASLEQCGSLMFLSITHAAKDKQENQALINALEARGVKILIDPEDEAVEINTLHPSLQQVLPTRLTHHPEIIQTYEGEIIDIFGSIQQLKQESLNTAQEKIQTAIEAKIKNSGVLDMNYYAFLDALNNSLGEIPHNIDITLRKQIHTVQLDDKKVGQLTKLTALNLSNTSVSTLPFSMGQLTNLQKLDMGGTPIATLPSVISSLTNLKELHIYNTHIDKIPSEIVNLDKLESITITAAQNKNNPSVIQQLTEKNVNIYVTKTPYTYNIPESTYNITKGPHPSLQQVLPTRLAHNPEIIETYESEIITIFNRVENLKNKGLTHAIQLIKGAIQEQINTKGTLNMNYYGLLSMLDDNLDNIPPLQDNKGIIRGNIKKITFDKEKKGRLNNIVSINLSNTKISTLPPSIGQLTQLQKLDIGGTNISTLPNAISQLTNLKELHIYDTNIKKLPEDISKRTKLKVLHIGNTHIKQLPNSIRNIENLTELYISKKQNNNTDNQELLQKLQENSVQITVDEE